MGGGVIVATPPPLHLTRKVLEKTHPWPFCFVPETMSGPNKKAECPHCGKAFSAQHPRRHIEKNHSVKRLVLVCPRCDHEETPAREDCMTRHINRNHGPLDVRSRRVSVPPYHGFRYCTVPGCRYRTAAEVHMRAHLRSRHPDWVR